MKGTIDGAVDEDRSAGAAPGSSEDDRRADGRADGRADRRAGEAGFTLVEVLVALALFAVIGVAGFSVLDQVLRVQRQTEGRLERLAGIQRAMHLVATDFMQAAGGSLSVEGGAVSLRRPGAEGALSVRYDLADGALRRSLSGALGQSPARQALLTGVAALDWRFYAPDTGWVADWPPETGARIAGGLGAARPPGNPAAVALEMTLTGPGLSGALRRVAILPAEAER